MKFKCKLLLLCVVLLLVVAIWLRPDTATKATARPETSPKPELRERRAESFNPNQRSIAKAGSAEETHRNSPSPSVLGEEFERLRARWVELGPGNGDVEKRVALAAESIESLMCSPEMHKLSEFLDKNGIHTGTVGRSLAGSAAEIFNGPYAISAREQLLESLRSDVPKSRLDYWCESAGRWCAPEDFQLFFNKVAGISKEAALVVMFGNSKELMKTDPNAALSNFLHSIAGDSADESQKSLDSYRVGNLIMFGDRFPPDTDFEKLTQTLEQFDPDGSRYNARARLFRSWAELDAAEAANFIMAHPEKYPAELIEPVANRATGNLETALQWVATFPRGPYRDAAAIGAADLFDLPKPDKARRFLPLVDDPKTKARLVEMIESAERMKTSGDKY